MEIRNATCSSQRAHVHRFDCARCEAIEVMDFALRLTYLQRYCIDESRVETKKLGRSEVGLAVVIVVVVVVVVIVVDVDDGSRADSEIYDTSRRLATVRFLIVRNSESLHPHYLSDF